MSAEAASDHHTPPVANRRPQLRVHHGDEFADPYEWLRDKDDPAVLAYLEAENAYTREQTAHLEGLTGAIFSEIKARTQETDLTVPVYSRHRTESGDREVAFWYYERSVLGSEYPIYCRAPAVPLSPGERRLPPNTDSGLPDEQVLLDANAEAAGHEFFSLGALELSPDGTLLAYAVDTSGAERFTLRLLDLTTGERLPDVLDDVAYGVAWAGTSHLFYTRADEAWRPYVVRRHRLGTSPDDDVDVVTEPDERFWLGVDSSRDDSWVVIGAASHLTSEYRLLSTADPEGQPRVVAARRQGVEYEVEPAGDRLLIVHNNGAEDFELAQAPLDATSPEQWTPVLPAEPGVRVVGVDAYAGYAVVSLRRDGLTGLHVLPRDGDGHGFGPGVDVQFPEPLYTVGAAGDSDYDTETVRLSYTSLLSPPTTYDYDLTSGQLTFLKQLPVLDEPTFGPYDPTRYRQERAWATAADGTSIPISLVSRADVPRNGSAPALLYGYGSYEVAIDPTFSIARLSLLDRGFVFAIAHVRGGGELGRTWYEQGKALTKRNTFTDFVACAEHLVEQGYTSPDRLAGRGASAGGLLMGAAANLAPQLFRAIHADVPFVDALTSLLDPELPLTVVEWEELGDPLHDGSVYAYMKSYSPYENVSAQDYPAILATTSLNDTRVFYVEPAKWVAALRHAGGTDAESAILLKTEMTAGHGGVSGRYQGWQEIAFQYAWIVDQTAH